MMNYVISVKNIDFHTISDAKINVFKFLKATKHFYFMEKSQPNLQILKQTADIFTELTYKKIIDELNLANGCVLNDSGMTSLREFNVITSSKNKHCMQVRSYISKDMGVKNGDVYLELCLFMSSQVIPDIYNFQTKTPNAMIDPKNSVKFIDISGIFTKPDTFIYSESEKGFEPYFFEDDDFEYTYDYTYKYFYKNLD